MTQQNSTVTPKKLKLKDIARQFPIVFSNERRSLKKGIAAEMALVLGNGVTARYVTRLLAFHFGNIAYLSVLAKGGPRYGLDGQISGEVTPEEQAHAASEVERLKAIKFGMRRRAALVRTIQASGLTVDAYARNLGLEIPKTQSEFDRGLNERRIRREKRIALVLDFELSGISKQAYVEQHGRVLEKFDRIIEKVAAYRDEATTCKVA